MDAISGEILTVSFVTMACLTGLGLLIRWVVLRVLRW